MQKCCQLPRRDRTRISTLGICLREAATGGAAQANCRRRQAEFERRRAGGCDPRYSRKSEKIRFNQIPPAATSARPRRYFLDCPTLCGHGLIILRPMRGTAAIIRLIRAGRMDGGQPASTSHRHPLGTAEPRAQRDHRPSSTERTPRSEPRHRERPRKRARPHHHGPRARERSQQSKSRNRGTAK
jgi:hypothetical protein